MKLFTSCKKLKKYSNQRVFTFKSDIFNFIISPHLKNKIFIVMKIKLNYFAVILLVLLFTIASDLSSYPTGVAGRTKKTSSLGCNCHTYGPL